MAPKLNAFRQIAEAVYDAQSEPGQRNIISAPSSTSGKCGSLYAGQASSRPHLTGHHHQLAAHNRTSGMVPDGGKAQRAESPHYPCDSDLEIKRKLRVLEDAYFQHEGLVRDAGVRRGQDSYRDHIDCIKQGAIPQPEEGDIAKRANGEERCLTCIANLRKCDGTGVKGVKCERCRRNKGTVHGRTCLWLDPEKNGWTYPAAKAAHHTLTALGLETAATLPSQKRKRSELRSQGRTVNKDPQVVDSETAYEAVSEGSSEEQDEDEEEEEDDEERDYLRRRFENQRLAWTIPSSRRHQPTDNNAVWYVLPGPAGYRPSAELLTIADFESRKLLRIAARIMVQCGMDGTNSTHNLDHLYHIFVKLMVDAWKGPAETQRDRTSTISRLHHIMLVVGIMKQRNESLSRNQIRFMMQT